VNDFKLCQSPAKKAIRVNLLRSAAVAMFVTPVNGFSVFVFFKADAQKARPGVVIRT